MAKPPPIDLRSIRYFLAVVDEGSFARAAETMDVTQPALSRSVQALEKALGVRLLDRGKNGVMPTPFGRLLIERGRGLLKDAGSISREIALLSGAETGRIAIGAGTYPAEICVGKAAARLLAARPKLKLRIKVGDWQELTDLVLGEDLDVAICDVEHAEGNGRLHVEPLPQHQGLLFCRRDHPLTRIAAPGLDELRDYPIAMTAVPERAASILARQGAPVRGVAVPSIQVDTLQMKKEIVASSDALGAAVPSMIEAEVRAGILVVLPVLLPWFRTRYGLITLAGRTFAPSLQLFMSEVRAVEAEIAAAAATGAGRPPRQARGPASSGPE
jgi:DNA-binding transcriptional LysR family regulator